MRDQDVATSPAADRSSSRAASIALGIAAAALLVDQISKAFALRWLADGPVDVLGPFSFRLVANRGILLGIPAPVWVVFVATTVLLIASVRALPTASASRAVGLGLAIGGALGNVADRLIERGGFPEAAVVDWITWSSGPTFNLADAFLLIGVMVAWNSSNEGGRDAV
ncbi:MAG: signal peptidase II [Acidimicrobiia bacterium]|nr:signal peptidase II [Acidimicrobiia bacterium]